MKSFIVSVDITMSKTIFVEAKDEESAKTLVNNWIADDPYHYAKSADNYISSEIVDVNEDNNQ